MTRRRRKRSLFHPAPCTLHPAPCTLHPAPYIIHTSPYTPRPAPFEGSSVEEEAENDDDEGGGSDPDQIPPGNQINFRAFPHAAKIAAQDK